MVAHVEQVDERVVAGVEVRFGRVGWWVLGVTVALSLLSMGVPALIDHPLTRDRGEIQNYLDVFMEGNLPTWWSVALLTTGALVHAVVGALARASGVRGAWAWFVSAAVLGALALDDHTQLHERLDRIGNQITTFERFPHYWVLPGLVLGAVVAGGLLLLAVRLQGVARWCMVGGCALLLGSALGIETLQGVLIALDESGPLYVLTYHAEELGENLGVLLMLAAAVRSTVVTRQGSAFQLAYLP
ncbi:hypothetical protein [Actinokineospora fastidiosa]|uniref:Uncharacterized protein n=1 Tax=Actinokineospora fastidiosa TaxID=1816 RepID=A0A918GI40_9PSEU|nr:hypothetical protein [Actinokineospora fastidiosa]GGS36717.1 hypothetical protein GCM10010171_34450 [Actinokineospora fastidiosa]